jgi:DNA (cytosine-5)-methyltransferase 1
MGGIDIAAEWAGFETVGQCEIDDYATKVLEKNFPGVPKWRDIRDVTAESFRERTGISPGELTLLSGGFPCQPHSVAGKRLASGDGRDMWGEFARVIREIRPEWVLGENVRGLLSSENGRYFGGILRDMDELGYNVGWCCYGASEIGALHRRERVFIVAWDSNGKYAGTLKEIFGGAHSDHTGNSTFASDSDGKRELQQKRREQEFGGRIDNSGEIISDSMCFRYAERSSAKSQRTEQCISKRKFAFIESGANISNTDDRCGIMRRDGKFPTASETHGHGDNHRRGTPEYVSGEWWSIEPDVGRVAYGIPSRVDRLKCLGNAVVPQQVYPILAAIVSSLKFARRRIYRFARYKQ